MCERARAEKIMQLIKLFRCRDIPRSMWKIESMIQRRCDFIIMNTLGILEEKEELQTIHISPSVGHRVAGRLATEDLQGTAFAWIFVSPSMFSRSCKVWNSKAEVCGSLCPAAALWQCPQDITMLLQSLLGCKDLFPGVAQTSERIFLTKSIQTIPTLLESHSQTVDNPACSVCWREFARQTSFQSFHTKLQVAHACTKEDTLMLVMCNETLQQLPSFADMSGRRHAQQSSEGWLKEVAARK